MKPDMEMSPVTTDCQITSASRSAPHDLIPIPAFLKGFNARVESLAGFEARGIDRVLPEERKVPSRIDDLQVALLWFSANISVNNLAVGLFGPLVFELGFMDSAMCATFGGLIGCLSTSYMSIWGPRSGNRTMVRQATRSPIYHAHLVSCAIYFSTTPMFPRVRAGILSV
jgi:hypothetical protein